MMKNFMRCLFCVLFFVAFSAQAQYLEEQGSLESIYENRARTVLNTILRPTDYSVVVSIDLDRENEKLKEVQSSIESQYLPGMPLMGDVPMTPENANKLHEIKVKTDVSVVLSKKVTPEVEKVIKELLISKLHLDISSGDVLQIKNFFIPPEPKEEVKPSLLPELSWKMWALVVVLSLLMLSGLMLLFWKRRSASENHDIKENRDPDIKESLNPEKEEDRALPSGVPTSEVPPEISGLSAEQDLMDIDSIKSHTLSIAAQYPHLTAKSISEHVSKESALDAAVFMESLGWEQSKRVFTEIPSVVWSKIGYAVKNNNMKMAQNHIEGHIRRLYKTILASYIEIEMGQDVVNPFAFLLKLQDKELSQILDAQNPGAISILCVISPADVASKILELLNHEKKSKVLSEMSRIEKISNEKLKETVGVFRESFFMLRERPEEKVNGSVVLSKVVRSMSPEEEMELLRVFQEQNPGDLERLRRSMLIFDDLHLVPKDLIVDDISAYEVDSLYTALFKSNKKNIEYFLGLLPDKKSMVLERDLQDIPKIPNKKEVATMRREIVLKVEKVLSANSLAMKDLVDGQVKSLKSVS